MVRKSQKEIISIDEIYNEIDILNIYFTERFIRNIFESKESANIFLAKLSIIPRNQKCFLCSNHPYLYYVKSSRHIDGFILQCKRPCTF